MFLCKNWVYRRKTGFITENQGLSLKNNVYDWETGFFIEKLFPLPREGMC